VLTHDALAFFVRRNFSRRPQAIKGRKSSFLKKRSKKLLKLASDVPFNLLARMLPLMNKSFLVLFFKKERLFSCFFKWLP